MAPGYDEVEIVLRTKIEELKGPPAKSRQGRRQNAALLARYQLALTRLLQSKAYKTAHGGRAPLEPTQPQPSASAHSFDHSPDYRSVNLNGKQYTLTSRQAQAIQMLHEAYEHGTPEVGKDYILEQLGPRSSRLRDTFKRSPLWGTLIVKGSKRGTVRLNLP